MNPKILILIYFILGLISAYYAKKSGRNPYLWFALGVFFGIWSLLILVFLDQKNKKTQVSLPNKIMDIAKKLEIKDTKLWYYLNSENREVGPMSFTKLHSLFQTGTISSSTYIWNEELKDWKHLKDTEVYNQILK